MERMCSVCRGVFDESRFRLIKKKKPTGIYLYRSGICLACEREKQSAYYYDRLEREYQRGRKDAIEELQQKIVGHLNDYALQEAPMYQDDLANQKPIYDAINNCIKGVIEVAENLKE